MASAGTIVDVVREERSGAAAATSFALVAFAANSLLCREALSSGTIDPVSFTTTRIAAGALVLGLIARARRTTSERTRKGEVLAAAALFAYALCFSLAYVHVPAATGALILFSAVQITMLTAGIARGERPSRLEWTGLGIALAGLLLLLAPGLGAPSALGASLMGIAGAAWGAYSLSGRGSRDPIGDTAARFRTALPLTALASLVLLPQSALSARGLALAAASGALASGIGYVVWYRALRDLSAAGAASVQLAVPVLAAAGGAIFLAEPLTLHVAASGALTLGGIALVSRAGAGVKGTNELQKNPRPGDGRLFDDDGLRRSRANARGDRREISGGSGRERPTREHEGALSVSSHAGARRARG